MAERLADLEVDTRYTSSPQIRRLRRQGAPSPATTPLKHVHFRIELARHLLRAGSTRTAIGHLDSLHRQIENRHLPAYEEERRTLRSLRAVSYLRLGEQRNCLVDHGAASCIFPIREDGVHRYERGSRRAAELYRQILADRPDDLQARWLLNLAHMTLGQHPDSVPDRLRIPTDAFADSATFPRYSNVAPRAGLAVRTQAGGSTLEDFDGDGDLDVLATSWGPGDPIRYFENTGAGRFEERTREAGLRGLTRGLNTVHGDYDGDGHEDVFVLRGAWRGTRGTHPNSLLRNHGDGTFTDVTEEAGLSSAHPTQTAGWADYDGDGDLDLFIGNESAGESVHPCELYRNEGNGTFTNVAPEVGLDIRAYVKGMTWGDYDNDGRPDLYVSVLGGANRLYRNLGPSPDGRWRFRNRAARAGVEEPTHSFPTWFFDFDNDGWLDLFVSGYSASYEADVTDVAGEYLGREVDGPFPRLYRNRGDGTFEDVTEETGLDRVLYGMGANFGDLDNDGFPDFYVGTGGPDFRSLMPNRMFRNLHGRGFREITAAGGFGHLQKGHGISFGDVDNDGDQDVFTVMGGAFEGDEYPNALFLNPGHGRRWVVLELVGTESNRSALGTRIEVRISGADTTRSIHTRVTTGGSFGSSTLRAEIGVGTARRIDSLILRWPASGRTQGFGDLPTDRRYRIREGSSEVHRLNRSEIPTEPSASSDSRAVAR